MNKSSFYDNLRKNEWKVVGKIGPSARIRFSIIYKLMDSYLEDKNSKTLDCGCGSGEFLKYLSNKGYSNLAGTDFSKESIKQSSSKISGDFYLSDLSNKNGLKKKNYEAIVCSEVLEHVEDDALALKNLFKALRKGGFLFISVPYLNKNWSHHDEFSGHFRRYEVNELENKLKKIGFKVERSFGWGNFVYSLYYVLLRRFEPKEVMSKNFKQKTSFIQEILLLLFHVDNLFISKRNGQKLFIVAKK